MILMKELMKTIFILLFISLARNNVSLARKLQDRIQIYETLKGLFRLCLVLNKDIKTVQTDKKKDPFRTFQYKIVVSVRVMRLLHREIKLSANTFTSHLDSYIIL